MNLFTPRVGRHKLRAHMELDDVDQEKFNQLPRDSNTETLVVFDHISEQHYTVRRADCGLNCFCAAEIIGPIKL